MQQPVGRRNQSRGPVHTGYREPEHVLEEAPAGHGGEGAEQHRGDSDVCGDEMTKALPVGGPEPHDDRRRSSRRLSPRRPVTASRPVCVVSTTATRPAAIGTGQALRRITANMTTPTA